MVADLSTSRVHDDAARPSADTTTPSPAWVLTHGTLRRPLVFVLLLVAFAPTAAYQGLVISDNAKASVAAWNVAVNGRLSYPEVSEEEARDGYGRYPDVFPGVYAVAIPAYWVARPLVIDPSEPHGLSLIHI